MVEAFIDPARPEPKIRPFKAMRHMRRLIANKEDTEQVFHIIAALNGKSILKLFREFLASPEGARRFEERRYLPPLLDDREWIEALPADSLGRAYVNFMNREGLTAEGLVEESEKFNRQHENFEDDIKWFTQRLRDTHDLFHVISGYGRDALGEASLLGFTHGQHGGRGILFIAFMGTRQIAKEVPKDARVWDAYKEGRRNGAKALSLVEQDLIALMKEPLEEVRRKLNVQSPTAYRTALRVIADSGLEVRQVASAA